MSRKPRTGPSVGLHALSQEDLNALSDRKDKQSKSEQLSVMRELGRRVYLMTLVSSVWEPAIAASERMPRELRAGAIELSKRCRRFLEHLSEGGDHDLVYELAEVLAADRRFSYLWSHDFVKAGLAVNGGRGKGTAATIAKGQRTKQQTLDAWESLQVAVAAGTLSLREAWKQFNKEQKRSRVVRAGLRSPFSSQG